MDVFERYANFYDNLYEDKDYEKECNFIKKIFELYSTKEIRSILDLGCGTGSHAFVFAGMGYSVTGVDQSESMLNIATTKAADKNLDIRFQRQDIRNLNLSQQFDAAIAMFAVMGYQVSNKDFEDALVSVYNHLSPAGLLIFDVWFGPAVLVERPQDRVKIVNLPNRKIIRYAHPILDVIHQTCEVNYTVLEITQQKTTEISEHHLVRYFFYQEILYFLEKNGFEVLRISPFMDLNHDVDERCWNIVVVCKKVEKGNNPFACGPTNINDI